MPKKRSECAISKSKDFSNSEQVEGEKSHHFWTSPCTPAGTHSPHFNNGLASRLEQPVIFKPGNESTAIYMNPSKQFFDWYSNKIPQNDMPSKSNFPSPRSSRKVRREHPKPGSIKAPTWRNFCKNKYVIANSIPTDFSSSSFKNPLRISSLDPEAHFLSI